MGQIILELGIMSLQASVMICVVLLLRAVFSKLGVAKKYINILWLVPYFGMICPWKFESAYGFWRQPKSTWFIVQVQENVMGEQGAAENFATVGDAGLAQGVGNISSTGTLEGFAQSVGSALGGLPQDVSSVLEGFTQGIGSASATYVSNADVLQVVLVVLGIIWLVGLTGLAIYSADAHLKLHKKLICCMHISENIYIADDIDSPFVLGIVKPRIYLPSDMPEADRAYVTAHEKTHIRRKDPLKKMLVFGITCIHWFNPLAWVAFHFYGKDMEMACDEETVWKLGLEHKQEYARTLLSMANGKSFFLGAPLAFDEGDIKSRIKNIIKFKKTWRALSVIAAAVIVVLAVGFMTKEPLAEEKETPAAAKAFFEGIFDEITVEAEPHDLTMEELILLCQAGMDALAQAVQDIPIKEDGAVYTNLVRGEENTGALNQSYFCYLTYEGKDYRLQLSYSKEDNTLWGIYLYHPASEDLTLLYTNEPARYTVNKDIEAFLNKHYDIEDYFTCTLPEGTWLSEFKVCCNDIFSGCLILGDYEEMVHAEYTLEAWYAPGGVMIGANDENNNRMQFENGKAVSARWLGNHMGLSKEFEYVEGCDMQALLYEATFDLFTAAELYDYAEKQNISIEDVEGVSKYWYVFMGEEDSEYVYIVYLNQEYFTKEDVIKLARSVQITYE